VQNQLVAAASPMWMRQQALGEASCKGRRLFVEYGRIVAAPNEELEC
jgi:hypothetical protein